MISPGTICFLAGLVDRPELEGLVVEVVGLELDADGTAWHVLAGGWLAEVFGDRDVTAQECNLRPIAKPMAGDLAKARRSVPANGQ